MQGYTELQSRALDIPHQPVTCSEMIVYLIGEKFVGVIFRRLTYFVD